MVPENMTKNTINDVCWYWTQIKAVMHNCEFKRHQICKFLYYNVCK